MALFCTMNAIMGSNGTQLLRTDVLTSGNATAFSVPVTSRYAWVKMWGAGGGNVSGGDGGQGGFVAFLMPVSDLLSYFYSVGTAGANGTSGVSAGGTPAGGDGNGSTRAAGGGRTEIYHTSQTQANALGIAAGGGGAAVGVTGGAGGADTGESAGGTGGTQAAGGTIGGAALQGGDAGSNTRAGGGDGYFGGGAGNGGGGGSNYINPSCTHTSSVRGNNSGDADYPGGAIGEKGNPGYLIVEWWSGDPFAAGLKV